MAWEFDFLYAIQELHRDWLNPIMIFFSTIGNAGICWIVLSIVLAAIPKTRKCGFTMMISMAIGYLCGNLIIKNLVARTRPCGVDETVQLLIKYPSEYSFPSGHTTNGISASLVIYAYYHRQGIIAILVAAIIAFSRMYLFVHFPTDILGGIVLGICDALLALYIIKKIYGARERKLAAVEDK